MAYHYNNTGGGQDELKSWIPIIACLGIFSLTGGALFPLLPIGLVMLFNKLNGKSKKQTRQNNTQQTRQSSIQYTQQTGQSAQQGDWAAQPGAYHYKYDHTGQTGQGPSAPGMQGVDQRERDSKGRYVPKRKPVDLNKGKGLTIAGAIIAAIFAIGSLSIIGELTWYFSISEFLSALLPSLGFLGGGLAMVYVGVQQQKKAKRFRKYLALIGKRESISVATLAQAMPVSVRTACEDLQEMLDEGMIPQGYLDMGTGRLVLNADGLQEEPPKPKEEPAPQPEEKPQDDDAVLREIRAVNDTIADPVMSAKIDRIEEITGKILAYQKKNPAKAKQLRSFLNYYLPTTLKILTAYGQMESQGIQGENINAAKGRIEGMMDKVVEGFEKQLDKLFADSAMDITTDVEVLERMLDKDGLSGGQGMTLGGV